MGLLDASAPLAPATPEAIAGQIGAFGPDLVGLHLKTLHIQPAYALAETLRGSWPLVAGGPHATVRPDEPFAHGFRYVIRGEAEETLVELADAIDGTRRFDEVRGLGFLDARSVRGFRHNSERGFLLDLDALAPPMTALDLFEPTWYAAGSTRLAPAGLLSSRGCPAACTFCSNNVTGRRFRYRSAAAIVAEIEYLQSHYGFSAFSFFDDSFAVGHRRMNELCSALRGLRRKVSWTCTAHPAHLDPPTLRAMKEAGCGGIDIGMESGDPGMLVRIGKGITVDRVLEVLGWCRDEGLHAVVNLMFGWPDETEAELDATIEFMTLAAPLACAFNARGVLVPYPGTEIYERFHERFGFTDWWLREAPLLYEPFPTTWSAAEIKRCYATDPALERNFFRHSAAAVAKIASALRRKADLTFDAIAQERPLVPAAGSR